MGVVNCAPAAVSTGVTDAPAARSSRISAGALKAAIPPPTISNIRLPCMRHPHRSCAPDSDAAPLPQGKRAR